MSFRKHAKTHEASPPPTQVSSKQSEEKQLAQKYETFTGNFTQRTQFILALTSARVAAAVFYYLVDATGDRSVT